MIDKERLDPGTWYDGFVWSKGKQQGVATLRWGGARFDDGIEGFQAPYKGENDNGFEPNVISVGEPAS
jgi:hypothetical protein